MRVLLGVTALGLLASCATSNTATKTFSNPDFTGRRFQSVAVYVKPSNGVARQQMEDSFVARLQQAGITAYSALVVWKDADDAPTRESRLAQAGIDSVLVVELATTGATSSTRTTGTSTPRSSTAGANSINSHGYATTGAYDPMNAYSGTPPPSGPTTTVSPYATFNVGLVDVATRRSAWVDKARATGNAVANLETLQSSFIETTVQDLVAADILVRTPVQGR